VQRPKVIREPRQALSAERAERIRVELPTHTDRVLRGLLCAPGLRTEEALTVRWSDFLELSRAGCTLKVDRVFVSGQIRHTTKTGRGRDIEIVAPLAADLFDLSDKRVSIRRRAGLRIAHRQADEPEQLGQPHLQPGRRCRRRGVSDAVHRPAHLRLRADPRRTVTAGGRGCPRARIGGDHLEALRPLPR